MDVLGRIGGVNVIDTKYTGMFHSIVDRPIENPHVFANTTILPTGDIDDKSVQLKIQRFPTCLIYSRPTNVLFYVTGDRVDAEMARQVLIAVTDEYSRIKMNMVNV